MTTSPPDTPDVADGQRLTGRQVRDLLSIVLMVFGACGLIAVLFTLNVLLGLGASSVAVFTVGAVLGVER